MYVKTIKQFYSFENTELNVVEIIELIRNLFLSIVSAAIRIIVYQALS